MDEIHQTYTITANGHPHVVKADSTVADLLHDLAITSTYVVVQLDGEIVPRTAFDRTVLKEGCKMEVITLAGGGSDQAPASNC